MIKNNNDLRQLVLETLEGVKDGTIDPRKGSAIARLSNVALQSGIAGAQHGGDCSFFHRPAK